MLGERTITILGQTNAARRQITFGIKQADRFSHVYIIGKTGVGKSTLIETMVRQDLQHGRGLCLLDPHGDLVERIYQSVPEHRQRDVLYFNVPDATNRLDITRCGTSSPTSAPWLPQVSWKL